MSHPPTCRAMSTHRSSGDLDQRPTGTPACGLERLCVDRKTACGLYNNVDHRDCVWTVQTVCGPYNAVCGPYNVACGPYNVAGGPYNVACGPYNVAGGPYNVACGPYNVAGGPYNVACGPYNVAWMCPVNPTSCNTHHNEQLYQADMYSDHTTMEESGVSRPTLYVTMTTRQQPSSQCCTMRIP